MKPEPPIAPQGYPPDTVMTQAQLAVALSTSIDTITRSSLEASYQLGPQQPRYIWKRVIAWLEKGLRAA